MRSHCETILRGSVQGKVTDRRGDRITPCKPSSEGVLNFV
jgi:hypothetical protein